jgi:hypothetical protein
MKNGEISNPITDFFLVFKQFFCKEAFLREKTGNGSPERLKKISFTV